MVGDSIAVLLNRLKSEPDATFTHDEVQALIDWHIERAADQATYQHRIATEQRLADEESIRAAEQHQRIMEMLERDSAPVLQVVPYGQA